MATWLKADGTETPVVPKNGRDFKLDELREFVGGGWVETVYLTDGRMLVVNDEGALIPLPINRKATELYRTWNIHGDVLLCERRDVR